MQLRSLGRSVALLVSVSWCACTASDDDPGDLQAAGSGGVSAAGTFAVGAGGATAGASAGASGMGGPAGAGSSGTGAGSGGSAAGTSGTAGNGAGAGGGSAGGGSGAGGSRAGTGGMGGGSSGEGGTVEPPSEPFSFFVTSIEAMQELSGSDQGFGGDLRFGEATGLAGADKICNTIADMSLPGASAKQWRAFLSTAEGGEGGGPVHAKDRIGDGPWYDRMGRLVAMDLDGLLGTRPQGDPLIANDLPNEHGEPNHQGVDNHDTITGSNAQGEYDGNTTCEDWTDAPPLEEGEGGFGGGGHTGPGMGHSWPAQSGQSWIAAHRAGGCAAGVNLIQNGAGSGNGIGAGGGYGGIYCFALMP